MNAKNVTPDETAPRGSAANETAKAGGEAAASAPDTAPAASAPAASAPATSVPAASAPAAEKPAPKASATKASAPKVTATRPAAEPAAAPATAKPVVAEPAAAKSAGAEPVVAAPVVAAPAVDASGDGAPATEVDPTHTQKTVYVTAPTPPKPKGNRSVGVLLAIVATLVFAAVYLGAVALLTLLLAPSTVSGAVSLFLTSPVFFVPVLVFLVAMILWVILANRASWWSWVIGSLVIALITYFASIGVFLLMQGGFGLTASAATVAFAGYAVQPALIAAGLIARESAIWFGAAIAKRGRKVRERNYEAWQTFEAEEAQKRAEFDGAAAA